MAHGFGAGTRINDTRLCIAAARRARYEKAHPCGEAETENHNEKKINAAAASTYNTTRASTESITRHADDFTVADRESDSDATTNSVGYSGSARDASARPRSASDANCSRLTYASSRDSAAQA